MSAAFLAAYFADRDTERTERADAALGALTDRERQLVREAAVMGYVLGGLPHREHVPPDSHVVRQVVIACQAHSDLYPLLGHPEEG